jgi:IS5 family transposase
MIDFETILISIFCLADDFCKLGLKKRHRGAPKQLNDAELLTLLVAQQLLGIESETSFLRFQDRFFGHAFPVLDQSQFNRRGKAVMPRLEKFRKYLLKRLKINQCDLLAIDSCPVPDVHPQRVRQSPLFPELSYGHCASLKESYYGGKLHLVINAKGIPLRFDLTPASVADIKMLDELLEELGWTTVVADKGYIDKEKHMELKNKKNILMITPKRKNQKEKMPTIFKVLYDKTRKIIETVFNQLSNHMQLKKTLATTLEGLVSRILRKITAFTCGICLNAQFGRKRLAIKSLLA